MNCSSKIGFEVVKLSFGHFDSKTQTSSRFPNDSSRKTSLSHQDWGNRTGYTFFPKQST